MAIKPKKRSKFTMAAAVFIACVITASCAFISVELAALVGGFFTIVSYVRSESVRRSFWENAISFKMRQVSDGYNSIMQKVTGTRQEIANLRQDISDIRSRVNAQDERIDDIGIVAPKSGSRILLDEGAVKSDLAARRTASAAASPAATRPGQKPAPVGSRPDMNFHSEEEYDDLSDIVVRELVSHAVRLRTIDIFVQPIVRLPQRRVRYYEIFARVRARPGMYLPARRYMKLAVQSKMSKDIDNMLLMQTLRIVKSSAHIDRAAPLFVNISESTLTNTIFLKELLTFISKNRNLAPRLVFEITQAQYKNLQTAPKEILRGLGKLGCAVSLDQVQDINFDLPELQRFHVRFIKISAQTLMPFTRDDKGRTEFQRQKRKLEGNGVSVIADKIETETHLKELLDFDIHYGQGYLFGKPGLEAAYRKRREAA